MKVLLRPTMMLRQVAMPLEQYQVMYQAAAALIAMEIRINEISRKRLKKFM